MLHYFPMLAVRLGLLLLMVVTGRHVALWPVFAVECASVVLGTWNALAARAVATGAVGLWTTCAYGVGVFVLPMPGGCVAPETVQQGYWLSFALSAWALWHLRECFTYGAPSFVRVVATGPYRWVRHPQLWARLLIEAVVFASVGWSNLWDVARCVLAMILTVSVMEVEDRWRATFC